MTASTYPGALDSFTAKTDGVDEVLADHVNYLQNAVTAIETELGTDPAGTVTDVKTRLSKALSGAGMLQFAAATTLTISSGAVTATQNFHRLDTEASAASDDLDTITAMSEGFVLFLRTVSSGRDVTIKHATGNIYCASGSSITLATNGDLAILIYDAVLGYWLAMGTSAGVLAGGTNAFTGTNSFAALTTLNGGVKFGYVAKTTNYTVATTDYAVNVDATAGAVTIALPTAAGAGGQVYNVRKSDGSANAVIIDGNGSETINGALTYSITTQYQSVTLMSDNTNWMIL